MNLEAERTDSAGFGRFLLGMIQIILNPRQGWRDAEKDGYNSRQLMLAGLCPFLVLVGCSSLVNVYYRSTVTMVDGIVGGVIDFTGYFVSVYISYYLFSWALDRWLAPKKGSENAVMTFVIYTVATMSFITLLTNIFPVDLTMLTFLPLYVVYVIWCGRDYLGIDEINNIRFFGCSMLTLFFPPYLLSYFISFFV